MAFFDKDLESEEHVYQKYSIRRLEPSIKKFLKVIDIDLGRLHQHKMNIEKYNRLEDWTSLNAESINATRTVQQIKANLHEIEKVRHQVCDEDLNAFDNKINDMRETAIKSVLEFTTIGRTDSSQASTLTNSMDESPEDERSCMVQGHRVQGHRSISESGGQLLMHEIPENTNVAESWENLQESLEDLNTMIREFATVVNLHQEKIDRIEDNIEQAHANVQQGTFSLGKAAKYKAALFPVAGALIGTAVGGPVGLVLGAKLGAVVGAVGAGTAGLLGGRILKKKTDKHTEMELSNLSTSQRSSSAPDITEKQ